MWTCGPAPVDPQATWPPPVLEKIVTSFTHREDHVLLLPWPTTSTPPQPDSGSGELQTALATIRHLNRTPHLIHRRTPPDPSRPLPPGVSEDHPPADLVVTSVSPRQGTDPLTDHLAEEVPLTAARLLRTGGILAALTHTDPTAGRLVDPTGPIVTAAQHADLLYLQHIVTLHTPIRDAHFALSPHPTDLGPSRPPDTHHRIHSDVLVFAQTRNHDHTPNSRQ